MIMDLRAIYLPDLAFNPKEGSFIFEYDINTNTFKKIMDEEVQCDLKCVVEDDEFMIFTSQITCDSWYPYDKEHTVESGDVTIINKKDIYNVIEKIKKERK
jgi:hypothetical protein